MTNDDERLDSLKTMSALSGVEVNVREVIDDWILLTYDLPHTEEGDKARAKFLQKARQIGAVAQTESVYLLPWTPESELMAIEVSKVGNAYLWLSTIKDEQQAKELTTTYDKDVEQSFGVLKERIARMKKHAADGKMGIVERMSEKTSRMLKDMAGVAARRGSDRLCRRVDELKRELEDISSDYPGDIKELEELL